MTTLAEKMAVDPLSAFTLRLMHWPDMTPNQKIVAVNGQEARAYLGHTRAQLIAILQTFPPFVNPCGMGPTPAAFWDDCTRSDLICRILIGAVSK